MPIENIPDSYLKESKEETDLFVYDFKMTEDVIKSKVNLNLHMFSFLREGRKQVHFADVSVAVNKEQSLLLKRGNSLWTEKLDKESIYFCRLFFFSDQVLKDLMEKHAVGSFSGDEVSYFAFENDTFIGSFFSSLDLLESETSEFSKTFLKVKFEELILYMLNKYGDSFRTFLQSLVAKRNSDFQSVVRSNVYSTLNLEEMAFLCNMSLSTFKRYFISEFGESPGKWLREKRLLKAKELLKDGALKSSDIYLELGYNNLSNFSIAFKNRFGFSPKHI